ncbi:MAG: flagellar biosynthesis anti-sigma factor FlgM [Acidobacteria bacterium]|nr:flagellar biosynthesis anti-sigma factor FlgM [Acidobacteriota bacterium]
MKIGDSNLSAITASATAASQAAANRASGGGQTGAVESNSTDAIQLSDFAKKVTDLQSDSPARNARVEQLRELYLSGNYQVDSATVARRIVDDSITA